MFICLLVVEKKIIEYDEFHQPRRIDRREKTCSVIQMCTLRTPHGKRTTKKMLRQGSSSRKRGKSVCGSCEPALVIH